jgi:hypothetical protein
MKLLRKKGVTNQTFIVFIPDGSATNGDGLAGVTASMLNVYYARVENDNDVVITSVTMSDATGTGTVHTDGVWEEISPNLLGLYRIDLPDAVFATGASEAIVNIQDGGDNNIAQTPMEFQLTDEDITDAATETKMLKYFQLGYRSDAAINTDNSTELTAINANGGSGTGDYNNTGEALEAVRDYLTVPVSDIAAVHSQTTVIESDTIVISSDTTAIHTQTTTIASDLVLIYSDTTSIHTQTTAIASDLVIAASDLIIVVSDTTAIHAQTTTIASDVVLIYSDTSVIEAAGGTLSSAQDSKLTKVTSDVVIVVGDTTAIHTQTTTIASDLVLIYSDTTAIHSQTTVIESDTAIIEPLAGLTAAQSSDLTRIESDLIIVLSDLIVITSDTTAIESELILVHSETTIIASDLIIAASDIVIVVSDTTAIHTQTTTIASDLVLTYSDTTAIHSQTTVIESDVTIWETATSVIAQGAPSATASPLVQLSFMYKAWRNKSTQTATVYALYDDAGSTIDHKATVSDDATTFTSGEVGTGP